MYICSCWLNLSNSLHVGKALYGTYWYPFHSSFQRSLADMNNGNRLEDWYIHLHFCTGRICTYWCLSRTSCQRNLSDIGIQSRWPCGCTFPRVGRDDSCTGPILSRTFYQCNQVGNHTWNLDEIRDVRLHTQRDSCKDLGCTYWGHTFHASQYRGVSPCTGSYLPISSTSVHLW